MIAWLRWLLGSLHEALETVDASIADSREIGNGRDEAFALAGRAEILLAGGDAAGALSDADASLALMRETSSPRGQLIAHNIRGFVLSEAWAVEQVAEAIDAALARTSDLGGRFQRAETLAVHGWVLMHRGDRAAALERFAEAWGVAGDVWLDGLWVGRQEILAWEGWPEAERLEAVGARMEGLAGDSALFGVWGTYARALGAWVVGDAPRALRLATRAVEVARTTGQARVEWRGGAVVASALEAVGRSEDAAEARAAARAVLERSVRTTPDELRPAFLARPDVGALLADA
jgi:tetratricopeptide (TPR) repeat protein